MEPKIIFEDGEILVLDKPAGMVVNRATSVKEETVQDWVEEKYQISNIKYQIDRELPFYKRAGIVHRIDKETSGLLLVAKTPETFENLQRQFKERTVKKTYIALVHGTVVPARGVIRAPVGRLPWNRERFGVLAGGREAQTNYKVISHYSLNTNHYSLLELYPKTGRTHQLRVHLKSIGHPIVSDPFYAGRKTARQDRSWCPRLFLHAQSIIFVHPTSKERLIVSSEIPKELKSVLTKISKNKRKAQSAKLKATAKS